MKLAAMFFAVLGTVVALFYGLKSVLFFQANGLAGQSCSMLIDSRQC